MLAVGVACHRLGPLASGIALLAIAALCVLAARRCSPENQTALPGELGSSGLAYRVLSGGGVEGADGQGLPLEVRPCRLYLGTLRRHEPAHGQMEVRNPLAVPLTVEGVSSSCPCVAAGPVPVRIEPNRSAVLAVAFDPKAEPEFRGRLAVELTGRGGNGQRLFEATVEIDVGAGPEKSGTAVSERPSIERRSGG